MNGQHTQRLHEILGTKSISMNLAKPTEDVTIGGRELGWQTPDESSMDMEAVEDSETFFVNIVRGTKTWEADCLTAEEESGLRVEGQENKREMVLASGRPQPRCVSLEESIFSGRSGQVRRSEDKKKR
jgi:hypothetical protein